MRQYDKWDQYPYNKYGNAVVLRAHLDSDWIAAYLIDEESWIESGSTGIPYARRLVVFQSWHTEEGYIMMSFKLPENKRRVLELRPELVVEADPFGPDRCPKCAGPLPEPVPRLEPQWDRGTYLDRLLTRVGLRRKHA